VRVLFVNHTGLVSGAEHSLLALIDGLPPEVVSALAGGCGRGGEPHVDALPVFSVGAGPVCALSATLHFALWSRSAPISKGMKASTLPWTHGRARS
jgi:hypothetical protein